MSDQSVEYEVPRIYSTSAAPVKSAKKKSNISNTNLEERIRKASGIGRQEQVHWHVNGSTMDETVLYNIYFYK